jgi:hypothetical protein
MSVIYKYPLEITDRQSIAVQGFESILKVAEQHHNLYMWCIVNPTAGRTTQLSVEIVGTGNPMTDIQSKDHFDSVLMSNGLVWHIFIPNLK